ncbi:hypothetical protein NA8A_04833 [Nitratireductor indicus C115]|uniref:Tail tubular protein A n=1 Tax=Nitratireductor indicus C115 TaxID=1231190 RepID=K2N771_9HYPH|nr:hypothetical protein [Nitratireductor indicus]EKF43328.1 hypothetical protein NA8A_04833 [Nitratireductor indicus C115]SFQ09926.1 hypothetical protein SAMN05216176_101338 [Nitratireductor indicus]
MDAATIINRALSRIGCLPIQSVASPGPAGDGVVATYNAVLEDVLSKYPWHFTKRFAALDHLTQAPPLGWSHAFSLPPGRLALPRGYYDSPSSDRPLLRFQIAETQVWTMTSQCYAEYQIKPDPAHWPGYFRELIVLCCAAEYALEIREDAMLRRELRRDAYGPPDYQGEGGQFKVASDLDAQAMPSQQPAGGANPLTDVRDAWDEPDDARFGW